jgi:hypothetical protein
MPVLIIRDDLYELELGEGDKGPTLKKVKQSYLLHNYHYNSEPKSATIFVVTFDGLADFIKQMASIKEKVEKKPSRPKRKRQRITASNGVMPVFLCILKSRWTFVHLAYGRPARTPACKPLPASVADQNHTDIGTTQ